MQPKNTDPIIAFLKAILVPAVNIVIKFE